MSILLNVYLFLGLVSTGFASGNQNISINSSATSTTGTWAVTGLAPYNYTFQPNAASDVSNLNVADIVACLTGSNTTLGGGGTPPNTNNKAGNVTILTASTGTGVGTGNVTISQPISAFLSSSTQLTFTITAAGSISINTISLKGNTGGTIAIAPGFPGANVILNSGTGVSMASGSGIQTDGGAGSTLGGAGANAGAITMTATTGNVSISIASSATGGAGGLVGGNGGNGGNVTLTAPAGTATISNGVNTNGGTGILNGIGGNAGAWNLSALSTVTLSVASSSNGGNGGTLGGNGGAGGTMSFISSASNVSMTNSINALGGNGSGGNSSGGNGGSITIYSATNYSSPTGNDMSTKGGNATGTGSSGSGGNITMTGNAANGGLTLGRTYTTTAGTGGTGTSGIAGTLTVSTGNSVVTSGGTNDGQAGSGSPAITNGTSPFTKTGTGTFLLGSANNSFTGIATVSSGILKIGSNNALGNSVASGTTVSNGATIDINNVTYAIAEALALTGNGVSNLGAMTTSTGTSTWPGAVTISGGTSIGTATNSTLTITGQVTGSGGLTKVDYGILAFASTSNNYTGNTTITTGTLQINASGVIPDASAVVLNGGTLKTNGAFSEMMGTLTVNAGSFITFSSAGGHTLTFANSNAITWATGSNITVTGWTGTYGAGTTGTTKLIVGSAGNVLTAAQLAKIQFIDAAGTYWAAQTLSTGEVVPSSVTGNTFYAIANGNWDANTTWSYTPAGAAVPSGVFPISTKNVVINGYTVTLAAAAAACNNITFGSTANGLTMAANNLTVYGNVNIVTACPAISTSGGAIVFDGTNNSYQTITSSCLTPSLGNVTLTNGANVSSSSTTTFSVVNFTSSTGTTSWTNNGATTLTVTGVLAAPSCSFISNNSSSTFNFNTATNNTITVGGLTSNSGGTINLGSKNTTISSLLSYTSGTLTSSGTITMAANSVIAVKNALTIANLQLGGSAVTSNGGGTLTATIFDFNGQTSFIQTAGIITTPTINNNTGPISMFYSGTPTFIYSGTGVIPSGSYYNLTTTTGTKSVTCSSTITVDGVLTNSSGTITGPATSGQFGRIVNANPVNNIGGTIGSASTNLSFSGSIQGGTIVGAGTNVLQNSSQSASCTFYTLSTASISGYAYCQGSGPSSSQLFTVSGSGLTGAGNVVVTGSTDYEVSSDNTTFGATASYPFASGIITGQPRTVYVRLKAGLSAASYNSENVTVTSAGGASAKTVSNSGSVASGSVTPSVVASSSAITICAGTSITLTAAPTNGGTTPTYQWSKGGTAISGATNVTYTTTAAANNDSYTVTMTSNAICASPATVISAAVVITVVSGPTALAGTSIEICEGSVGNNITAGAMASNYSNITWSSNGTGTFASNGSLTTATYTPSAADATAGSLTLTLTASGTGACSSVTATLTKIITIHPLPAVTGTTAGTHCGTGTVSLAATSNIGTLDWYAASTGGSSLGTGTTFNTPIISATTIYYVEATNLGCPSARTAVTATIDNSCAYTWTGGTSTVWGVGSNWSTGNIPTSTNDIVIPATVVSGNMPVVSANLTVKSLSNAGSITFTGTGILNVSGNISNTGTITTVAGSTINMVGTTAQTITGLPSVYNLGINNSNGVSLATALTVNGTLSLVKGVLTTNNNLIINFDAGGNIGYNASDLGTINGKVSGVRNLVARTHYISVPFNGITSGQIDTSTVIRAPNGAWLMSTKKYDTQGWTNITNYTTVLSPISGYSLAMYTPATIKMSGSYTHGASYSSANYTNVIPSTIHNGMYLMVGNPYPSTLDWDNATGWTKTNINDAIYFWNPVTNSVASYVSGTSTNSATQYIGAMQSFLVKVTGLGGTASVLVNNNARVLTHAAYYRTSSNQIARLVVKNAAGTSADETVVRIDDLSTEDFDSDADASKIKGGLSLYTKTAGSTEEYSINTLPITGPELLVPLNLKVAVSGLYTIECSEYSVPGYSLILEDKKTQSYTLLDNSTIYTINANKTDSTNRFVLRFVAGLTTGVVLGNSVDLKISTYDNQLMLNTSGIQTSNATVNVYDASGLNIMKLNNQSIAPGIQTIALPGLSQGVYIVKIDVEGSMYVGKVVIK